MDRSDPEGNSADSTMPSGRKKAAKAARPGKPIKTSAPPGQQPQGRAAQTKSAARLESSPAVRALRLADGSVAQPDASNPDETRAAAIAGADGSRSNLNPAAFRRRLMPWYRAHARTLPWRGTTDPYHIWVSEIMLQQTRVAAVIDHYHEFLRRFPTLVSLALAPEADVLAAWSGLGYYRRARMLHKAAQFIMLERQGRLPTNSIALRTLPGIGEYTAAAIASIAFGEAIAVVDGNVERVILRLTGRANDATAAARAFIRSQAQALVPRAPLLSSQLDSQFVSDPPSRPNAASAWDASERIALAASAHPASPSGGGTSPRVTTNAPGDHNQAMMELGATLCLPRAPLCPQCPVNALCLTRGEHATPPRAPQRSLPVACLLDLRKRGPITEVLLERRPEDASLMPAMYELPSLPLDAVEGREPALRVRHAITNTNYYVQVFAPRREPGSPGSRTRSEAYTLRRAVPGSSRRLQWTRTARLASLPLTGLTRKILQRLHIMDNPRIALLE